MRKVVSLLFVLNILAQLHAQPVPSGALKALDLVPAPALMLEHGGLITFTDWAASFAGRGGEVPTAWSAPGAQDRLPELLAALPPGAPHRILEFALMAGGYPDALGIDLFHITSTVEFGQPPAQVLALRGGFNQDSIQTAFGNRDYVVAGESGAGLLLCPVEGCDQGMTVNLLDRDMANPFGGSFGRRQPALAADDHLVSSPSDVALEDVARVMQGADLSLASLDEVQAITELLSAADHLLNLTIVNPGLLSVADPLQLLGPDIDPAAAQARLAELAAEPLPPYSLAAYAATIDSGLEHGLVVLVYGDAQQADLAAASLEARLNSLPLGPNGDTVAHGWSRAAELTEIRIEPAADLWIVTVQVSGPVSPSSRGGVPFLMLLGELMQRDTLWLLPGG